MQFSRHSSPSQSIRSSQLGRSQVSLACLVRRSNDLRFHSASRLEGHPAGRRPDWCADRDLCASRWSRDNSLGMLFPSPLPLAKDHERGLAAALAPGLARSFSSHTSPAASRSSRYEQPQHQGLLSRAPHFRRTRVPPSVGNIASVYPILKIQHRSRKKLPHHYGVIFEHRRLQSTTSRPLVQTSRALLENQEDRPARARTGCYQDAEARCVHEVQHRRHACSGATL